MQRKKLCVVSVIVLLLISSIVVVASYVTRDQQPFYVGVTYGGNSVQEAKDFIDKVKNCTNLFILSSGRLQTSVNAMNEIGDYAISSNLNYAIYGSTSNRAITNEYLIETKERWGDQFIGVYYNDELGGEMLDGEVVLELLMVNAGNSTHGSYTVGNQVAKGRNGEIKVYDKGTQITYWPDGKIDITTQYTESTETSWILLGSTTITYYPNGTITANEYERENIDDTWIERNKFYTSENITKYTKPIQTYEQVLKQNPNPIQTYDDAAEAFIAKSKESFENRPFDFLDNLNKTQLNEKSISFFTADYGLYWWDYQGGYDFVLAELGWNNSITQEIALVRGAANLQNKQWGTIITWKYTHTPFLTNGDEMFEQMKTSYQAGAKYVIVFNYSEDPENPNTLQEEHFQALERFWNDVVQNSKVTHGSTKAKVALVLPQNYGWGMRHPDDHIWGIWRPDETSQQIWNQLQSKIDQHGLTLDIVFEDSNYPVAGKYSNIYYWNQK